MMNPWRIIFLLVLVFFAYQTEVEATRSLRAADSFSLTQLLFDQFAKFKNKMADLLAYLLGREYCGQGRTAFSLSDFQKDLRNNLFGQPLVQKSVGFALKAHFDRGDDSKKALVLSFHGMQGTGKNFVADWIVKNVFKKHKEGSKFVHFFNRRLEFTREGMVNFYQQKLENDIDDALRECPDSIFIFDEVDKIPRGVLNALKPYLNYHDEFEDVGARRAVFIFLSNAGSKAIMEKYLEFWTAGVNRDDLSMNDFDSVIQSGAFNEDGGLQFSDTISSSLIDHYVPFLPLEGSHIRDVIVREIEQHKDFNHRINKEEIIEDVFKTITFGPKPEKLFSNNGAKRVEQQVATAMTRMARWRSHSEL